jgi:hypothetical protein
MMKRRAARESPCLIEKRMAMKGEIRRSRKAAEAPL